ncbi:hypothetical protein AWH48_16530 [Domibacillus aminovorans]|uniref:Uncharacterized protein n=1 Tax=Domibacillus aminovorans TaxID=29332 RepID=A0A177KZ30_9BACI|nr:hypothetical protein [Domibacillus aminovorans]OAH58610.1 hypothetical protein AWH48_16530 [Domibacillus aminovorans]
MINGLFFNEGTILKEKLNEDQIEQQAAFWRECMDNGKDDIYMMSYIKLCAQINEPVKADILTVRLDQVHEMCNGMMV